VVKNFTRLANHTAIYGLGGMLTRLTGFLLLPLYTYYLTPADYGILEILSIVGRFLSIFLLMGLGSAIFKSTLYDNDVNKQVIYSTTFYFLLFSSALAVGILIFVSPQLAALFLGTESYAGLLSIALLATMFTVIGRVPLVRYRIEERPAAYSFWVWFGFLVTVSLNIYFVAWLQAGLDGLVLAGLIGALVSAIVYIATFVRQLSPVVSWPVLRAMLAFGLPLIAVRVNLTIMDLIDRLFLRHYSSLDEVGLYAIGYKFGTVIILVVTSVQQAWPAIMFNAAKTERAEVFYARVLTYYLVGLSMLGLAVSLLSEDAIQIMTTPDYYTAYRVVPLIVLAYIFYGIYYITAVGVNLKNKNHYLPFVAVFSMLVHLGLNFLLIPPFGMIGAGISTTISYFSFAMLTWWLSLRFYKINYEYGRLLILLIFTIICYFLGSMVTFPGLVASIAYRTACTLLLPMLLYLIGFFTPAEKAAALRIIKQTATRIFRL
jgi:O-antigen/teichoic acid export membrane protein